MSCHLLFFWYSRVGWASTAPLLKAAQGPPQPWSLHICLVTFYFLVFKGRVGLYSSTTEGCLGASTCLNPAPSVCVCVCVCVYVLIYKYICIYIWCSNGRGMDYPVYGIVHAKDTLLLLEKSSPCNGGSGFSLSVSECVECIVKINISFIQSFIL